jgi:hypothetical protein
MSSPASPISWRSEASAAGFGRGGGQPAAQRRACASAAASIRTIAPRLTSIEDSSACWMPGSNHHCEATPI